MISVLDVVDAVDGTGPLFVCTEIRRRGPMATPAEGCTTPCAISRAMAAAEAARREALQAVSVADLAAEVESDYGAGALNGIAAWLGTPGADEATRGRRTTARSGTSPVRSPR